MSITAQFAAPCGTVERGLSSWCGGHCSWCDDGSHPNADAVPGWVSPSAKSMSNPRMQRDMAASYSGCLARTMKSL
jgi:hypothetical protein